MLPLSGSAAVNNGSDLVTWAGAALNGLNCVEGATVALGGVVYFVRAFIDTDEFRLTRAYAGANGTVPAEIQQLSPSQVATATLNARAAELIAQLSLVEEIGRGLFYRFSTATADADPGPGYIRLNNADPSVATMAYFDLLDAGGADVSGELDSWDDSTSTTKGRLWLRSQVDRSAFHVYAVSAVTVAAGYRKPVFTHLGGSGSFAQDEALTGFFVPTGDAGDAYEADAEVADVASLATHAGAADGFRVFVGDLGAGQDNRAGVVRKSGGSWPVVALYTGPKGDKGDQGDKGWSPQLVTVSDGARRVQRLAGYVGGAGTAPTANVGEYLKSDGTFTATIGDAVDIRGPAGLNGAGTVASVVAGAGIQVDPADPTAPVVRLAAAMGQCQLVANGGNLVLLPKDGNLLGINGRPYAVPGGGVSLSSSGTTTDTLYYVYAYISAGVIALEVSATGHSLDTSTGMRVKAADTSRTLVGWAARSSGADWENAARKQYVRSYFNDPGLNLDARLTVEAGVGGTSWAEVANNRISFVSRGENIHASVTGGAYSATYGANVGWGLALDTFTTGVTTGIINGKTCIGAVPKSNEYVAIAGSWDAFVPEGLHQLSMMGKSYSGDTVRFNGDPTSVLACGFSLRSAPSY